MSRWTFSDVCLSIGCRGELLLAQYLSFCVEVDVVGAVGHPVEDRVGHQLALDPRVPHVGLQLGGDERGRAPP